MPDPSQNSSRFLLEQRSRWERGDRVSIEALLQERPLLADDTDAVLDLIYQEVLLREQGGESPGLPEYQQRFPQYHASLASLFEVHQALGEDAAAPATPRPELTASGADHTPPMSIDVLPVIPGYGILAVLARGGMGVIYKARQQRLDRIVALKLMRPDQVSSPEALRRFRREARAAAQLSHPHIVQVYDSDHIDDNHFLVMEFVAGTDLARLVMQQGPLSCSRACACIRQAALGLQHAHERGLVHRDVKPANLMLDTEGTVKLLDLGLARLRHTASQASDSQLTEVGCVLGTPDYMAPEQAEDPHGSDIRADLYGLGCTFYFLLTGQAPFPSGTLVQKIDSHRWRPVPPLASFRPDVLPEVEAIIGRLLAKRPEDRFQTPAELAAALQPFESNPGDAAPPAEKAAAVGHDQPTVPRITEPASSDPAQRRVLLGHSDWVMAVALAPDGTRCASGSRDRTVRLWDVASAREVARWDVHLHWVRALAFLPDGQRIITAGRDKTLRLWDVATGREVLSMAGHGGEVECVAVAADGRSAVSGSADQTVRLWSLATGKEIRRIGGTVVERHWDGVLGVALTPDGRHALSASRDKTLRFWDLETGKEVRCLRGPSAPVPCVAVSPDGKVALSGGGNSVRIWDLQTGEERGRLKGHAKEVLSVAFSPDGKSAVSASEDRTIRLWDLATTQELRRFDGHMSWVLSVAFASDGRHIASGGADRTVCLWQVPG